MKNLLLFESNVESENILISLENRTFKLNQKKIIFPGYIFENIYTVSNTGNHRWKRLIVFGKKKN